MTTTHTSGLGEWMVTEYHGRIDVVVNQGETFAIVDQVRSALERGGPCEWSELDEVADSIRSATRKGV